MPFLVFWEGSFLSKVLANRLSFLFLFLFAWLCVQILDFILYFVLFWSFLDIRISKVYSWSVKCSCIDIIKFFMEVSERMSKSGFFLSWLHVGQDSRFSSKIYNEGQKCWDSSLKWPLFEQWTYLSPPPVFPHPLPLKPKLYFRPSSLSFTINNIDSGMGGFTTFKQNEIINEWNFRQVWQIILSLMVACEQTPPCLKEKIRERDVFVMPRGFNKHQQSTKLVGYFAHKSRYFFPEKKAATSLNNVVNKKCIIKINLNENVTMMCFYAGPLVLRYTSVM